MTISEAKTWIGVGVVILAAGAWIARAEDAHESAEQWQQRGVRIEKTLDRIDAAWEMRCRSGDYDEMMCEDRGFEWHPRTRGSAHGRAEATEEDSETP